MKSVIAALIATAVGLGVMLVAGMGDTRFMGYPLMLVCGVVAFAVNWAVFIPANIAQSEKYYDLTGSVTYLSTILIACYLAGDLDVRAMVVASMVIVWALRLGTFLFARIRADGHDRRFNQIKVNPTRFFFTWTLQGTWVALTAAAAYLIITSPNRAPLDLAFFIGSALWLIGFLIEVVADNQKKVFKSDAANEGRFITSGLWSWSRHPNYFGEMLLWFGIFVMALPLLAGPAWIVAISPVFVYLLLTKLSGIPMLAASGKKRWGDDPDYIAYLERTSLLIPLPPKK